MKEKRRRKNETEKKDGKEKERPGTSQDLQITFGVPFFLPPLVKNVFTLV